MKIADRVYLITDQLQTGAGIPGVIRAMEDDSMVEVAVEFTHGTKILKVRSCDILPSNLYTHSILNVVYQGRFDGRGNKVRQARRAELHPTTFALLKRVRGRERRTSIRAEAFM
jgi:hypothetical protein